MALATYTDLQTSIASWLNRSDLTANIPDFIALAEARISRDLRLRSQVTSAVISTVAGSQGASLPTGWLEFENVSVTSSPDVQLTYVNIQYLDTKFPNNSYTGCPVVYSIEGQQILFGPIPDAAYSVNVLYYKKYDALSVTPTNWLLTNHPGIYLWASLAESAPFLRDDERALVWETKYQREMEALQESDTSGQFSGSALRVRSV
ncbi:MAG: hypothetical protein ACM3VZ_11385 [Acidobacteriota bacterium]